MNERVGNERVGNERVGSEAIEIEGAGLNGGEFEEFGAFVVPDSLGAGEALTLQFTPSLVPLRRRWRNNGLSADFLADYAQTFLPDDPNDPTAAARQLSVKGAVSFIANELLENAMKFGGDTLSENIIMRLHLRSDGIVFHLTNGASAERASSLRRFVRRLEAVGADTLLMEKMETPDDAGESGLGLLTMMTDHGARLAFRLAPGAGAGADHGYTITTQVELDI